jgi:hypothetical protein
MQHRYNKVIGTALMVAMFGAPLAAHADGWMSGRSSGALGAQPPVDP